METKKQKLPWNNEPIFRGRRREEDAEETKEDSPFFSFIPSLFQKGTRRKERDVKEKAETRRERNGT